MVHLLPARDEHFAWLLGEVGTLDGLTQPPGGVDEITVIQLIRRTTAKLHAVNCRSHWLIVHGSEIVGLCGFKHPPDTQGIAEIGYGIAPARRRQRFATKAVALMLEEARQDLKVHKLVAGTAEDNQASQSVLITNGFVQTGWRNSVEDGNLILWTNALS